MNKKIRKTRQRIMLLILAGFLLCGTACSSKETALLQSDDLVWEDGQGESEKEGAQGGQMTAQTAEESALMEPALTENPPALTTDKADGADKTPPDGQKAALPQDAEDSILYVHICGQVVDPGVYQLPYGSRIYEAVEAAGGFTEEASESYVNLAQLLTDGQKIEIPALGEEAAAAAEEASAETAAVQAAREEDGGLVDINTASASELCSIPGVGESRAESIISYREENGGFLKIEDIMKVEGIKEGMFSKMKDKICVRGVR